MRLETPLTRLLNINAPIVGAPMGGVSGATLCAAVSNAGGLGMIGAGYGDADWMRRELASLRALSLDRPWGVGLITWSSSDALLDCILEAAPQVVMLSFGDLRPYSARIRNAGCKLMAQVQSVAAARAARDAGADLIVAQGTEAGGHGAQRTTLALVPAVVDAVAPTPVLAAGGIGDGRGLAAALMLGAVGVLVGTRFYASAEALGHPRIKQRLLDACGDETTRTEVYDIVRGLPWPKGYTGRAVANTFVRRWNGNEQALRQQLPSARAAFDAALNDGDPENGMVWAGECIDLIHSLAPAGEILKRMVDQAAQCLHEGAAYVTT